MKTEIAASEVATAKAAAEVVKAEAAATAAATEVAAAEAVAATGKAEAAIAEVTKAKVVAGKLAKTEAEEVCKIPKKEGGGIKWMRNQVGIQLQAFKFPKSKLLDHINSPLLFF